MYHTFHPNDDNFQQVWSWYNHPLFSQAYRLQCFASDTLRDLITLTYDHRWSNITGHMNNPFTKYEDPTPIHSWVMSYDVSHWILMTMSLEPLRMRRSLPRHLRVWGNISHIFEIRGSDLSITLQPTSLYKTFKINQVIRRNRVYSCVNGHHAM